MPIVQVVGLLVSAYLLGSLPIGYLVVKTMTGKDVRREHSGRTGGTNALRVAGFGAGLVTAVADGLKGACAVFLSRAFIPKVPWIEAAAAMLSVFGHVRSIFLIERVEGKLRLGGGAGGAPTVGAAIALWPPGGLIIVPLGALVYFGIGYASVTTLSTGFLGLVIFLIRALCGLGPWAYVAFAVLALGMLSWTLRPNLQRLREGTERNVRQMIRKALRRP